MARMLKWLGMATLSIGMAGTLVGCVPQEKYNALRSELEAQTEQLNTAQQDSATAKAENNTLKSQLAQLSDVNNTSGAQTTNLNKQLQDVMAQNASLSQQLKDALEKPAPINVTNFTTGGGGSNPLPEKLNNELQSFANANPNLVDFDPIHGIVKFKSDVTFSTGSADLTSEARTVIDKFASILNSPAAGQNELMVAGHTDNVPVNNPETVRRFGNNITLSAYRAIAVYNELGTQGISKGRMAIEGYGEQRPVMDNATASGRKANRRVEVLILPTRHTGPAIQAGSTTPRRSQRTMDLNKDSSSPSPAPAPAILNK